MRVLLREGMCSGRDPLGGWWEGRDPKKKTSPYIIYGRLINNKIAAGTIVALLLLLLLSIGGHAESQRFRIPDVRPINAEPGDYCSNEPHLPAEPYR